MSNWRNKIPHEQVESDPTKQNIITGQLHRLIKLGVLMPEASQISDTGIYVTIGLPSPTVTSKLQVGGTVAASEAEYDYELATLGQVKALAVPTLPQLKTINNESIVGTGNIVISVTVDQTIIDGSTNAVSGNAVFDGLAGKANLNGGNEFTGSQWFSDFTMHAKPIYLGTNSLNHGTLYSHVVLGNINGHFAFTSDARSPVVISTELLTNISLVKLIVPNKSGTIALLSDIPSSTAVDQTIIDGSTNAVSGNAVFDGLALKANLVSPTFTGIPTAPTATSGVSTTQIATTAFVQNEINTAAYSYVKILGNQSIYGTKKFIANTMFFGLMAENTAEGSVSFYASTQNNHPAVFVQGLGSTGNVVAINANPLASGNLLYIDVGSNPNLNFILGRKNSADVFKIDNNAVVTATSFVKGNTATSNILLAGGGDIPQSTFATSFSPTFTGIPTAPTAAVGTNTTQIATTAFVLANSGGGISFLEHDDTGKTVWNNGKGDGSLNTSFGERALESNTTGNFNTAYGFSALWLNTTGAANTAIGVSALGNNIAGSNNTAIGVSALLNNTSGGQNVAIGGGSQSFNNTGGNNVSIGVGSLGRNIAGNQNVAIGNDAGTYINLSAVPLTSSYWSIFIGHNTSALVDGSLNEIVIGYKAIGAGSNTVTLGNESITKTVLSGVIQKRYLDTAPASATATGTTGEIRVTSTHIYVCIATNTWVHSVLTTW